MLRHGAVGELLGDLEIGACRREQGGEPLDLGIGPAPGRHRRFEPLGPDEALQGRPGDPGIESGERLIELRKLGERCAVAESLHRRGLRAEIVGQISSLRRGPAGLVDRRHPEGREPGRERLRRRVVALGALGE